MSAGPGWYPDPDGTPGRLRYYDGQTWTNHVRAQRGSVGHRRAQRGSDGHRRAQRGSDGHRRAERGGRRSPRIGLMLGVLAVVLVIIIVGVVVFNRQSGSAYTDQNLPTSTVSGWDDSSPSPEPSSAAPSESSTPSSRPVACDLAIEDQLPEPPDDGRVHGGPLSFQQLPNSWREPAATRRFPYSRDSYMQNQRLPEKHPWQASAQVGVLTFEDKPDGKEATSRLLQCLVTSSFYTSVDVTIAENDAQPTKIGSTTATRLEALLTFSHPDLTTKGSRIRIIVVDTDPATYYFHAVPMERDDLITELDEATGSLRVD